MPARWRGTAIKDVIQGMEQMKHGGLLPRCLGDCYKIIYINVMVSEGGECGRP
jgi:hypothetical protein